MVWSALSRQLTLVSNEGGNWVLRSSADCLSLNRGSCSVTHPAAENRQRHRQAGEAVGGTRVARLMRIRGGGQEAVSGHARSQEWLARTHLIQTCTPEEVRAHPAVVEGRIVRQPSTRRSLACPAHPLARWRKWLRTSDLAHTLTAATRTAGARRTRRRSRRPFPHPSDRPRHRRSSTTL